MSLHGLLEILGLLLNDGLAPLFVMLLFIRVQDVD
jgi:hypothetical protein